MKVASLQMIAIISDMPVKITLTKLSQRCHLVYFCEAFKDAQSCTLVLSTGGLLDFSKGSLIL